MRVRWAPNVKPDSITDSQVLSFKTTSFFSFFYGQIGPFVFIMKNKVIRSVHNNAVLRKNTVWIFECCHASSSKIFIFEECNKYLTLKFLDTYNSDEIANKILWKIGREFSQISKKIRTLTREMWQRPKFHPVFFLSVAVQCMISTLF